jgi:hypothetical protein
MRRGRRVQQLADRLENRLNLLVMLAGLGFERRDFGGDLGVRFGDFANPDESLDDGDVHLDGGERVWHIAPSTTTALLLSKIATANFEARPPL